MRPVNVLHHVGLRWTSWGGVQVQFENFIAATEHDPRIRNFLTIDTNVLPPHYKSIREKLAGEIDFRRWNGLPVVPRFMRGRNEARQAKRLEIDAVVNTNYFGKMRPAKVAHRAGAAAIYWERGAAWFTREKPVNPEFSRAHDMVICNSYASQRMLEIAWNFQGPMEFCQPCVWKLAPQGAATGRSLPKARAFRLGFAARLRGFKGGVLAVHALAALVKEGFDATLSMAGEGPDRSGVEATATALGVADRVTLLGHVRNMGEFYASVDLLLHPALREPYGNVCAEAALQGLPVVTTRVDGLPEVVEDNATGLCVTPTLPLSDFTALGGNPADVYPVVYRPERDDVAEPGLPAPDALAAAVLKIAASEEEYGAYSRRAVAAAQVRFAPQRQIDQFTALMRKAAKR